MRRRVQLVAMSTAMDGGGRFQRLLQIALTFTQQTEKPGGEGVESGRGKSAI